MLSDNNHKLIQTMRPEAGFLEKEQRMFEDLEHKLRENLTKEDR